MARIKIITDSASDIPQSILEQYNISFLPICVVIDDKIYRDGYDLNRKEYMQNLRTMENIPTTSMVPMSMFEEEFKKNLDEYDHQILITMSAKGSGGNNAAHLVKQQLEDEMGKELPITILDSERYSMLYGMTAVEMAKRASEGAELDELLEIYEKGIKSSNAYFMVDDLKHLEKGGRIKPGVALIGGLLGIKPILTVNDGLVENIGKERGRQKALEKIVNLSAAEYDTVNRPTIWVASADSDDSCHEAIAMLNEKLDNPPIELFDIGCVIGTHAGAGLVGIIFKTKGE